MFIKKKLINKNLDKIIIKNKLKKKNQFSGRNNTGKLTVLSRSGGNKKLYRIIEFNRFINSINGIVKTLNYDPNRSAIIAGILVKKNDFLKKMEYIIAPKGIYKGLFIQSRKQTILQIGNSLSLEFIPIGSFIHNVSLNKGQNSKFSRSAGTCIKLLQKNDKTVLLRLPSGEERLISKKNYATIGFVSNKNHSKINLKKAGRSRWIGKRPHVRGVAKNPVDHPHGGGEGKTSGGRPSVSPQGMLTKGQPTRKRLYNKFVLKKKNVKKKKKK